MYCTLSISLFSNFLLSSYLTAVVRTEQGLEIGDERISKITESSFTQICPLIIRLLLNRLYEERGGVVVSEGEQHVGCIRGEESNVMSPNPPHPFHPLILQQATGQVSRHWLHLLHLGCLAFFSSPKWSCKFHVAGRVTDWEMGASKWEIRRGPGTSKLHNGLSNQHWTSLPVVTFNLEWLIPHE